MSSVISALLGIVVTVIGALIIGKLQSREPHLSYSVVSSIPFSGPSNVVSIYQVNLTNDGKREVENVTCFIKIPGWKIDQHKISIAPSINVTENIVNDALVVQIAGLNPSDTADISILASAAYELPSHPQVSIHAKGVNGEEKTDSTKRDKDLLPPVGLVTIGAIFAVFISGLLLPLVRRVVKRSDQADTIAEICRNHGFEIEAARFSKWKGDLSYRDAADMLTSEALEDKSEAAIAKVRTILSEITAIGHIAAESRAIVLYDLARLEAFRGNETMATVYLNAARVSFGAVVESRLKTHPLILKAESSE